MNKSSRFFWIGLVLILLTIGCSQEKKYAGPVEKITVAAFAGDITALVYFAKEKGLFEKKSLEVTINDFAGGKATAQAMLTGKADISTSSSSVFVSKSFIHSDLRTIGTISTFEHLELIARKNSGISSVPNLKGKSVGLTKGSSGEFFLGTFLLFNGLDLQDIEIVDLSPVDIVNSILKGSIDAGFTWDPYIYYIKEALGENAVSWPGQSGQAGHFLLLTTQTWIDNNPEALERFLASLLEAEDFSDQNPKEFKDFTRKKFNYKKDYIDYVWPKTKFTVSLPQSLILSAEDQARWRIENKLTDKTEEPNYWDYIYLKGLKAVKSEAVTIIH